MDSGRLGLSVRPVDRVGSARKRNSASTFQSSCLHLATRFTPKLWCSDHTARAVNGAAEVVNGVQLRPPKPEVQFPRELDPVLMPEHVAIIMDGNSRWARRRGLLANRGHEAGVQALRNVVSLSSRWGIKVLTVFAFSTENWMRPKSETEFLMLLFEKVIAEDLMSLFTGEVCVQFIGDLSKLSSRLRALVSDVEEKTRRNNGLKLVVALSYSGRQDITQACKALAADVKEGALNVNEIDESKVRERLQTSWDGEIGDPDLLIRTSGEKRLSNFILWQLAYTELVFVDELWPDFGEAQYRSALLEYQRRDRRFGKHK